jgi:hypothetical protein
VIFGPVERERFFIRTTTGDSKHFSPEFPHNFSRPSFDLQVLSALQNSIRHHSNGSIMKRKSASKPKVWTGSLTCKIET